MVDDKYIGLALAISSSFAIGSSFIITKKVDYSHLITNIRTARLVSLSIQGLNQTSRNNAAFATDAAVSHAYLQNPVWWLGMATSTS